MRKVKLPRINNEVEEDQMKVDGVGSLLEKVQREASRNKNARQEQL